jgi:orotate phosphoribosyltransferase
VVDDLLNSGATFKHALKALAEHNVQVVAACVLVNFEKSGEQFLRRLGIPLYFAFTLREIKPKQTKTRF